MKALENYDVDEVAIWLSCIGLGPKVSQFRENGIDGNMLVTLTDVELEQDLGLTRLQAKKVLQQIDFTKELVAGDRTSNDEGVLQRNRELEAMIDQLQHENARLKSELKRYQQPQYVPPTSSAQVYHQAPAPAPSQQPSQTSRPASGGGVLRGAAGGAASGAVKGAIVGAILPGMDASDGAKAGAAAGAAGGAMHGLRERRFR